MTTAINVDVADGVAWMTIDGPDTRNALDASAAADLVAACEQVDDDPSVGAAVITGAGGAFCCTAAAAGVFARPIGAEQAVASGLAWALVGTANLRAELTRMSAHLAADPTLARALVATLRRVTLDTATWDRAVEIERAGQMWSLTRSTPSKES